MPGKQAWFDENRPRQGTTVDDLWVGDLATADVPTCGLGERIGAVRDRLGAAGPQVCVVVNGEGIVLGMLRAQALAGDPRRTAEQVMDPGPKTFRPSVSLEELLKWMREHDVTTVGLVTTSLGRLVGAISRADAEATFGHEQEHAHAGRPPA